MKTTASGKALACAICIALACALAPAAASAAELAPAQVELHAEDAKAAIASAKAASYTYAGSRAAKITVKGADGRVLKEGADYRVSSVKCRPGTRKCTARVTGINGYTGTKTVKWTIRKASMKKAKVSVTSMAYRKGRAVKAVPAVKLGGKTLKAGTDYKVSYASNRKVGIAKVKITGKNFMSGTKTAAFRICRYAQPMRLTAKAQTVDNAAARTVKAVTAAKAKGKVTYANASAGAARAWKVNAKTGALTVPAGTAPGTYTVKVKAAAKGNKSYAYGTKTASVKVTVKAASSAPSNPSGGAAAGSNPYVPANPKYAGMTPDSRGFYPELARKAGHKHVYDFHKVVDVPAAYDGFIYCRGCGLVFYDGGRSYSDDFFAEQVGRLGPMASCGFWKVIVIDDAIDAWAKHNKDMVFNHEELNHSYTAAGFIITPAVTHWEEDPAGAQAAFDHFCACGEPWRP